MGAYALTGTGCKKDFNKGVLLVAHIWSYTEENDGAKIRRSRIDITTFGGERSSEQLQIRALNSR